MKILWLLLSFTAAGLWFCWAFGLVELPPFAVPFAFFCMGVQAILSGIKDFLKDMDKPTQPIRRQHQRNT